MVDFLFEMPLHRCLKQPQKKLFSHRFFAAVCVKIEADFFKEKPFEKHCENDCKKIQTVIFTGDFF